MAWDESYILWHGMSHIGMMSHEVERDDSNGMMSHEVEQDESYWDES